MATAKVFRSENGQALRLPKGFWFTGKTVEIFRRGDEIILREKRKVWRGRLNYWRRYHKTLIGQI
jgi:virulence-associated protein VagC